MYYYSKEHTYADPLNIAFLCGSQYAADDLREKRNILRTFLEENCRGCRAIILEDNFWFRKTNMQYLSYDSAFLKNLAQVEQLASMYANKIFIIHETISTAAELGMFAINPSLAGKICILTPDDIAIDERKVTGFIAGAFIGPKAAENRIGKRIVYYPDVEIKRRSPEKSDYYTYFHNNCIGENLGKQVLSFMPEPTALKHFSFLKCTYGKLTHQPDIISYLVDEQNTTIHFSIHASILKILLMALFSISSFRTECRKLKTISEHISYIVSYFQQILLNTASELDGLDFSNYSFLCDIQESICNLRQSVGYYVYMLQAARLIVLEQQDQDEKKRKIRITTDFDQSINAFSCIIQHRSETAFGRYFK